MAGARHKRDANARRKPRAVTVAGSVAMLATGAAVVAGLALHDPAAGDLVAQDTHQAVDASTTTSAATSAPHHVVRERTVSRDESRTSIAAAKDLVDDEANAATARETSTMMWTSDTLNLWTAARKAAANVGEVEEGKRVLFTGRTVNGRDEIVVAGHTRWVTHGYLTDEKPVPTGAAAGLSDAPCPDMSVENGLTAEAIHVYRSVCHAFPQITTYGGWDAHGEHSSGKAIDIMTSDKALGDQIAGFLQSHASELDLYDVIWWDRIWTPVRSAEGWRAYGDHGSATANHMDHVHVSTNG